jgi:hypothetical protein
MNCEGTVYSPIRQQVVEARGGPAEKRVSNVVVLTGA